MDMGYFGVCQGAEEIEVSITLVYCLAVHLFEMEDMR